MAVRVSVHLITAFALLTVTAETSQPAPTHPAALEHRYVLNAKVRPLLLFWIGRDNVGDARITWQDTEGRRVIELLVGTDPDRAPRQINRWGYLREDVSDGRTEVIGLMTASNEQSLDEAESEIERRRTTGGTVFQGMRTTAWADRASTTSATLTMPERMTYRQLDTVLSSLRTKEAIPRHVDVPPRTHGGFLFAMTSLIHESAAPCRTPAGARVQVAPVAYLYKQTLYDAALVSCTYRAELPTKIATFRDVVDARFQVRNRHTGRHTNFSIAFGLAGNLRERPVRIVFRPRWWMEAELLLDQSAGHPPLEVSR